MFYTTITRFWRSHELYSIQFPTYIHLPSSAIPVLLEDPFYMQEFGVFRKENKIFFNMEFLQNTDQ